VLAGDLHEVGGLPHAGHVFIEDAHGPNVPRPCDADGVTGGQLLVSGGGGGARRAEDGLGRGQPGDGHPER
jgi:hypothetical protein